jgi:hypothetical protein
MKRWFTTVRVIIFSAIPVSVLLIAFNSGIIHHGRKAANANTANAFAVIELFTSEGCSSCPPADDAVAKASKEFAGKVYVLGFHVDYWNKLGWRDQFSSPFWTFRQAQYVQLFNLNGAYTPQVVINGKKQFVGSDEGSLKNAIEEELKNQPPVILEITAQKTNDKSVSVSYNVSKTDKAVLNIALVQLQATTAVKKGENQNKTLSHINIVRELETVRNVKSTGTVSISLPSGSSANDFTVIAYLQDKDKWQVLGAAGAIIK